MVGIPALTATKAHSMSTKTNSGNSDSSPESIDYDDYFKLLSNHRRRYTLHYLKKNGEDAELGELSEQIAAWENDVEWEEVTYDQRKRVYTSLQQVHLPRMDDIGVVDFDDREGVASLTPAAEEVDIYFELVAGNDIPWSSFYLFLSAVDAVVLLLAAILLSNFDIFPGVALAVFVLITFTVTALAHTHINRTEMHLGEHEKPPELR
ncbi:hypothetical protein ACFQJ7_05355 [Halovenus rubra]|uniref:DUF7344 domain-containing protein n=2 Tax=Halovenus rubra TaxID=869890 RepID=A0ABD5X3B3_9EURY|nr:hypothetical protein [Halovenus rubra]